MCKGFYLINSTSTYFLLRGATVSVNDDLDLDDDGVLDAGTISQEQIIQSFALVDDVADSVFSDHVYGPAGNFLPAGLYFDGAEYVAHNFNTVDVDATQQGSDNSDETETVALGDCGSGADLISAIQGESNVSPLAGQSVIVEAVVTNLAPELNGYFIQEEAVDEDENPNTSEALFVFDDSVNPQLGQTIRMRGEVTEFFELTELKNISEFITCDTDASNAIAPLPLELPLASSELLESLEGMLVEVTSLTVTENYNHAYFGELTLSNGRLFQPTQVAMPGAAANAVAEQNALNQILIDDKRNGSYRSPILAPDSDIVDANNPLRNGDLVSGTANVFFSFGNYKLQANEISVTSSTPRPQAAPEEIEADELRVMSFNVLNYFTTLNDGNAQCGPNLNLNCRGANTQSELDRQTDKLVAALSKAQAHVISLNELENNGFSVSSAIATLVTALNDATGKQYAFAQPEREYIGEDAITVGIIYDTERVMLAQDSEVVVIDDAVVEALGGATPLFNGEASNRASLAASFQDKVSGGVFTIVANHFKSKGPSTLADLCDNSIENPNCDQGDGQGFWNDRRTQAAQMLDAWLQTKPTQIDDDDVLIMGDLNAYRYEDPVTTLEALSYQVLVEEFNPNNPQYSYVFFAQFGTLDYAMANESLASQVLGASEWHINADEARYLDYNEQFGSGSRPNKTQAFGELYQANEFRSSDHDPIIVQVDLDDDRELESVSFFQILFNLIIWLLSIFS